MTLNDVREKYKNKNHLEVSGEDMKKALVWLNNGEGFKPVADKLVQMPIDFISERIKKLHKAHRKFLHFIESGVIISINKGWINAYPFEFVDDCLHMSAVIYDPLDGLLKVYAKLVVDGDLRIKANDNDFELIQRHLAGEILTDNPLLAFEPLKFEGKEETEAKKTIQYYVNNIVYTQVISVLGLHTYLAIHEKSILISKIDQSRVLHASKKDKKDKKHGRHHVNPLYRYQVSIPAGYKPRKFELNWVLSEWDRATFCRNQWVRVENAQLLADRRGGDVLWETQVGDKVQIYIPIASTKVHRKAVELPYNPGLKTYGA